MGVSLSLNTCLQMNSYYFSSSSVDLEKLYAEMNDDLLNIDHYKMNKQTVTQFNAAVADFNTTSQKLIDYYDGLKKQYPPTSEAYRTICGYESGVAYEQYRVSQIVKENQPYNSH